MKYKIGDKVIFFKKSYKKDAWSLKNFETYTIINRAFDHMGIDTYYGVEDKKGQGSSWYLEQDFISLKEYRKLKIKKLNDRSNIKTI